MTRAEILSTASRIVTVDRAATHGNAEDQFATIAARWGVLLGVKLTPAKVALMLADLKLVRAWTNPAHGDNFVDLAGYAACGGEIATSTKTPNEGLPFDTVKAERDAALAQALQDMARADAQEAALTELARLGQELDAALDMPAAPRSGPPEGHDSLALRQVAARDNTAWTGQISGGEDNG